MVESETLIGRIKAIKAASEKDILDKVTVMRNAFDEYAARYPIAKAVVDGETTFLQGYEYAFGNYDSGRLYMPYSLPENFEEKGVGLEACIGNSPLEDHFFVQKVGNPIGFGVLFALAGSAMIHVRPIGEKPRKIGRREFIYKTLIGAGAMATAGAIGGSFPSWLFDKRLENLKQNAIELDTTYAGLPKR